MRDAEPPLASFGRLAEGCLRHDAWPDYARPQARSLASLFSKLDRDIELDWLEDRPQVREVLSQVLKCSPAAVDRRGNRERREGACRWRFAQTPGTRALELSLEGLPPGFPSELSSPTSWGRLLWRCATRDEAELAARWLEARGLARVERQGAPIQPQRMNTGSKLILALDEIQLDANLVGEPEQGDSPNICLVVPAYVPAPKLGRGWRLLESPRASSYAADLAHWLGARLKAASDYSATRVTRILVLAADIGLVDGFDAALGLAYGLVRQGGGEDISNFEQLAARSVAAAFERSSVASRSDTQWLAKHAFDALLGIVGNALKDESSAWDAPRTALQWQALVPPEWQQSAEVEWTRVSLASEASSADELERRMAALPSGAYRVFRAFESAGLFSAGPEHVLTPRWLALWSKLRCQEQLLETSIRQWGAALLNPSTAETLRSRLSSELESGSALLDVVPTASLDSDLASTLAIETLFELSGRATLLGYELPLDQLRRVWRRQSESWLSLRPDLVTPRALCSHQDASRLGSWLLAAWAIAERLPDEVGLAIVQPWATPLDVPEHALDAVFACIESGNPSTEEGQRFRAAASSLLGRLFQQAASIPKHPLTLIPRLLASPTWEDFRELSRAPEWLSTLQKLQGGDVGGLPQRAWQTWQDAGRDSSEHLLHPRSPLAHLFWPHVPIPTLRALLSDAHPFASQLPYPQLSLDAHRLLLITGHDYPEDAVTTLPALLVSAAVETSGRYLRPRLLRGLWRAHPETLERELELLVEGEDWELVAKLFEDAPTSSAPALLELLREQLETSGLATPFPLLCRAWLQVAASSSHPARLQAYTLLTEIELRLSQLSSTTAR